MAGVRTDQVETSVLIEEALRLFRHGQLDQAVRACQQAYEIDPDNIRVKKPLQIAKNIISGVAIETRVPKVRQRGTSYSGSVKRKAAAK